MSRKKPREIEDQPFASIPPRETFDAFPDLTAFPESAIAFLTGRATGGESPPEAAGPKDTIKPDTQPVSQTATSPAADQVRQTVEQADHRPDAEAAGGPGPQGSAPLAGSLDPDRSRDGGDDGHGVREETTPATEPISQGRAERAVDQAVSPTTEQLLDNSLAGLVPAQTTGLGRREAKGPDQAGQPVSGNVPTKRPVTVACPGRFVAKAAAPDQPAQATPGETAAVAGPARPWPVPAASQAREAATAPQAAGNARPTASFSAPAGDTQSDAGRDVGNPDTSAERTTDAGFQADPVEGKEAAKARQQAAHKVSLSTNQTAGTQENKPYRQQATGSDSPSVNQTANQSDWTYAGQPVSYPVNTAHNQPANLSQSRTHGRQTPAPAHQTAGQSDSPPQSRKVDLSLSISRDMAVDLTRSQKEGLSFNQTENLSLNAGQPVGRVSVADRLNPNQRRVLDLLLAAKPYIVKFRDIALALDMREASVRTILRRLEALSFLSFKKARDGNIQGVTVTFNQQVIEQYHGDQTLGLSLTPFAGMSPSPFTSQPTPVAASQTASLPPSQPVTASISQEASHTSSDLRDRKETISLSEDFGWDETLLGILWPQVCETGFGLEQIVSASRTRAKLGKELDRDRVSLTLDRAEWELETLGQLTELATGERVRNPAGYIFTALARWGVLRAHPQYVSREEEEAAKAADELRRRREAAEKIESDQFESYKAGLDPDELEALMRQCPGGNREVWLKIYWRRHVRGGRS